MDLPSISAQDRQLLLEAYQKDTTVHRLLNDQASLAEVILRLVADKNELTKQLMTCYPGPQIVLPKEQAVPMLVELTPTLLAAQKMDWGQVVLNGGPPCFHICEDGRFCGRAERWDGHDDVHKFTSLADMVRVAEGRIMMLKTALRRLNQAVQHPENVIELTQASLEADELLGKEGR